MKEQTDISNPVFKITKSYSRKVSLKAVSSQYDNIECGTYISAEFNFNDQKDLDKKMEALGEKVYLETERDISVVMNNLIEAAEDPKNSAVLGLGKQITVNKDLTSQIDGLDDLFNSNDDKTKIELPSEFGESDIEF